MNNQEQITMTDLEAKLLADEDGSFCQELIAKLEEYSLKFKQELDRGLPLDEFEQVQKVREAIEAGIRVLKNLCLPKDILV